jgi:uncharacterized phage protein gp47/JayE
MSGTRFLCCTDARRAALQARPELNGIDYLEVSDLAPADLDPVEAAEFASLPPGKKASRLWQRKLTVFFVNPLRPEHLAAITADTLRVDGGERPDSRNLHVAVISTDVESIVLRASARGDFSIYRLSIVRGPGDLRPPDVFDPLFAAVDFSFKVECPSDFDCATDRTCPPSTRQPIDIDYLARDYATFRRLMLDRIAAINPGWRERHAPDLGIALVELFAYVGDYLSYRQDAVATEAYLGTARRRVSVRRHARLVDYPMHEGCNARAWVQVVLADDAPAAGIDLPYADIVTGATTKFLSKTAAPPTMVDDVAIDVIRTQKPEVFELLLAPGQTAPRLQREHNELPFYTWGASECCLPKGATRATLEGRFDRLRPGDVLILEETCGPRTGQPADADPSHRQAVRLTDVSVESDPLGGAFLDTPTASPVDVTQIAWRADDALRFALCVSSVIEEGEKKVPIVTAVARGNIVSVDHGQTVDEALPDAVPKPRLLRPAPTTGGCTHQDPVPIPPRYAPALGLAPVTQAAPWDNASSAGTATTSDVSQALPQVSLASQPGDERWDVRRDLLRSNATAADFVLEVESDGTAAVRFGDGTHGRRPAEGTTFTATYRVGNGARGNVGAEAIAHIATTAAGIDRVRNPLAATGGIDPEPVEDVRRFAPVAFRTQERAVTTDDYAQMAERHPSIQRAAARFRWTGSWRTVFVTADPLTGIAPDDLDATLEAFLEQYRMAGHDVDVDEPQYVPLEIAMQVCAQRDYFRADVKGALADVFSSRVLPDGRRGIFHPDNFTFGQSVFLSQLYAAAYSVDGVESVAISTFQRLGTPDATPLAEGRLDFSRLEIARLDNDPSVPDRGVFRFDVAGGK